MEAQNHNQPRPANPTRTRRKWLRWLGPPAAVAVLLLIYQLSRPPELVWWRSPLIGTTGRRVRVLIPDGWEQEEHVAIPFQIDNKILSYFSFKPIDRRPALLRRLLPRSQEWSGEALLLGDSANDEFRPQVGVWVQHDDSWHRASMDCRDRKANVAGRVIYTRSNLTAFNHTYKQICDSLTIE